jgi:SAM-dependent methyltransferase
LQSEFQRLEILGWRLPNLNSRGLFTPSEVDENSISFPSESYDSLEVNNEASGYWALERANAIAKILSDASVSTLWEIGAGNGNAAIPLRNQGFNVIPIEPLKSGASTLAKNGFQTFHATLEDLKFPSNSIDAIGAFDVLEHLENPDELLTEIHRVLKPGGVFICSVPAYQWLFSDFDQSIGHFRRYSMKSLTNQLTSSKFTVVHKSAIFAFLIIPAFILRRLPYLMGRRANFLEIKKSLGGNSSIMNSLEKILAVVNKFERRLCLPFGLTILCTAKKV